MRELKAERIREMTEDDIQKKIRELKEELFHLRFRNQMRQLPNALLLREKRRDVARLETILAEHRKGVRSLAAPGMAHGAPAAQAAPEAGRGAKTAVTAGRARAKKPAKSAAKGTRKSSPRSKTAKSKG